MKPLGIVLLAACAYFVCGKLGIYLAIPPGYATAVWPSSGVALALALRFGRWAYLGTWLGRYLINASISHAFENPSAASLSMPGIIGLGAVLQAGLGSYLVTRYVGCVWSSVRCILMIILLGGPISCLVGASVGTFTLLSFQQITPFIMREIWLTWWIGDTLGVMTFTPALIVLILSPAHVNLSKRITVVAPLIIMFLLVTLAYLFVRDFEEQQRRAMVDAQLSRLRSNIEKELKITSEIADSLQAFFATEHTPSLDAFNRLTQHHRERHTSVQALEWVPLIQDAHRADFESAMQANGFPQFQIRQRNAEGRMEPAQKRSQYFPVTYVTPLTGNEEVLGFDLASNAQRRAAIEQSSAQAAPLLSAPIPLVQLNDDTLGYLLFDPVFVHSKAFDKNLQGFILLVFVPKHLIDAINKDTGGQMSFLDVIDVTEPAQPTPLMTTSGGLAAYQAHTTLQLLNRNWEIALRPSLEFLQQVPHWQSYAVLFAGWPFIMLLSVLLITLVGSQLRIENQVQQKSTELAAASERAQKASRAKSEFLANMSHELRTPLNSIIGFTHQILTKKAEQLDARSRDGLQIVQRNANHLLRLINDLLDISKIEAGKLELAPETFNILALCKDVAEPFQPQANEKNIALIVEADAAMTLYADRMRMFQVLLNLVSNAFKFTQQGSVRIAAEAETRLNRAGIRFDVADTGTGIAETLQPLLFNKFVQLEEGRQAGSGTGLGLALVKEIVMLHGGEVTLHSKVGEGSLFSLWIPHTSGQ